MVPLARCEQRSGGSLRVRYISKAFEYQKKIFIGRKQNRKEIYSCEKHFQFKYREFSKIVLKWTLRRKRNTKKIKGDSRVSKQVDQ